MKSICSVIVSYNSGSELKKCIRALNAATTYGNLKNTCIVVDNNSKDSSVSIAKKEKAQVISNKKNVGFAAAVNQGLRVGLENNCDYFLILNPDAVISKTSLSMMAEVFKNSSKHTIGAVGPNMTGKSGKESNSGYYLRAPSFLSVTLFQTMLRKYFIKNHFLVNKLYEEQPLTKSRSVEQIPGACMLTTKEVLKNIGLLDDDFAIWYEDVEWNYRARRKGYTMWFCKEADVQHIGAVSFEKWQSIDKAVTFYVSLKTFFRKHKLISYPFVVVILTLNSLFLYLKSKDKSNLVFVKKFLKQKKGVLPN